MTAVLTMVGASVAYSLRVNGLPIPCNRGRANLIRSVNARAGKWPEDANDARQDR